MASKNATLLITLSNEQRDHLRKVAAERTLAKPNKIVTASGLVREIVTYHLENGLPIGPDLNAE
jgi:hypothetical protein